ncbi:hypothetical protein THAOC_21010, partial [Thalassiosira oceanica]
RGPVAAYHELIHPDSVVRVVPEGIERIAVSVEGAVAPAVVGLRRDCYDGGDADADGGDGSVRRGAEGAPGARDSKTKAQICPKVNRSRGTGRFGPGSHVALTQMFEGLATYTQLATMPHWGHWQEEKDPRGVGLEPPAPSVIRRCPSGGKPGQRPGFGAFGMGQHLSALAGSQPNLGAEAAPAADRWAPGPEPTVTTCSTPSSTRVTPSRFSSGKFCRRSGDISIFPT